MLLGDWLTIWVAGLAGNVALLTVWFYSLIGCWLVWLPAIWPAIWLADT